MRRNRGELQILCDVLEPLKAGPLLYTGLLRKSGLCRNSEKRHLDPLEENGLIEIVRTGDRRRTKIYFITTKGRQTLIKIKELLSILGGST